MKRIGIIALVASLGVGAAAAQTADEQRVLGPGLYVFQTRTVSASCDDDERTGYVSTFVAPIHGVPGSRAMRMQLINSPYWASWDITVAPDGTISGRSTLEGASGPSAPTNAFEVTRQSDRFVGRGTRRYTRTQGGRQQQCTVTYDALLRRFDV